MSATAPKAPLSPAELANASLLTMLGFLDELNLLYATELNALKNFDMKIFADLQPRKYELVHECEMQVKTFKARTGQLKDADAELKARVIATQESLNILASESQYLCQARASSMARIQKRLLEAARHIMTRDKHHYNNKGKSEIGTKARPISTALNEAI